MKTIPISYSTNRGRGTLSKSVVFDTPVKGYSATHPDILLKEDGQLTIRAGFEWDYASGAIDTPAMIWASLPHDAFWDLRNAGKLPKSEFGVVDSYFRKCLKAAGEGWLRRWYAWAAVRIYSMKMP